MKEINKQIGIIISLIIGMKLMNLNKILIIN